MKLLVVEDDPRAAKAVTRGLHEHGFLVQTALDGPSGLAAARQESFDLLILDVMLPGLDGFTLLEELRSVGIETPVLFLTAKDALPDRLRGLALGRGDYLVKPFAFSELLLRIQLLLNRPARSDQDYGVGDLSLNPVTRKVYRAGHRLDLSPQEFSLLHLLVRNAGHVVTRTRIMEELYELAFDSDPNLVDAAIRRLRKKVDEGFEVRLIQTQRGVGYRIEGSGA